MCCLLLHSQKTKQKTEEVYDFDGKVRLLRRLSPLRGLVGSRHVLA